MLASNTKTELTRSLFCSWFSYRCSQQEKASTFRECWSFLRSDCCHQRQLTWLTDQIRDQSHTNRLCLWVPTARSWLPAGNLLSEFIEQCHIKDKLQDFYFNPRNLEESKNVLSSLGPSPHMQGCLHKTQTFHQNKYCVKFVNEKMGLSHSVCQSNNEEPLLCLSCVS